MAKKLKNKKAPAKKVDKKKVTPHKTIEEVGEALLKKDRRLFCIQASIGFALVVIIVAVAVMFL